MNKPLISICIPTYNGQKFFEACLDSAIGQTYRDIEIIIVDDCSTDRTWEITKSYAAKYPQIKVYQNEKNIGLVSNWSRCMELSTGEWIKFLFQDDTLDPDCIAVMVSALSGNDKIITSGRRRIFNESLDEAPKKYSIDEPLTFEKLGIISQSPVFISPEKISSLAVKNICINFIGEPTVVMFKREIMKELGIFNPDLIQICDLEYFLRIACKYGIKYIPKPLTYFRVHKDSTSASNISKRLFLINNTDPLIVVHELLYGKLFEHFRESLGMMQKIKLKLFFVTRVYESRKTAGHTTVENRGIFDSFANKYPYILRFSKGNSFTNVLLKLAILKRLIRKNGK